jgi:3-oxoacyl-[acyl-carrier-protein] synthase II
MNDASETRGIRRALGAQADHVTVTSTKSMLGHLVASCGGVEAVVCLCSLRDGAVHQTLNLTHPDPDCDLDYVPEGARTIPGGIGVALSNSFGFGGCNATLAFGAEGWR